MFLDFRFDPFPVGRAESSSAADFGRGDDDLSAPCCSTLLTAELAPGEFTAGRIGGFGKTCDSTPFTVEKFTVEEHTIL